MLLMSMKYESKIHFFVASGGIAIPYALRTILAKKTRKQTTTLNTND